MSLYDDSARIPFLMRGPGVPEGVVREEPISQLDLYPTVAEAVGIRTAPFARGKSLLPAIDGRPGSLNGDSSDRPDFAFSESHANGRVTGSFMIRTRDWKLIENVGYEPMLFNLKDDPQEMRDLAPAAQKSQVVDKTLYEMRRRLYSVCSPEAVTARANLEQRLRREHLASTGRLFEELKERFCLPDPDRLLLDPEAVEKRYGIKISPH